MAAHFAFTPDGDDVLITHGGAGGTGIYNAFDRGIQAQSNLTTVTFGWETGTTLVFGQRGGGWFTRRNAQLRFLTRKGFLIKEQGMTYLTDTDLDPALGPVRAAACTYRTAVGPRARQKVLSLQTVPTAQPTPDRCVNEQGFSLHAEVCCAAHQRKKLQHLCRYITRPAIANERLALNLAGQVLPTLKTPYRERARPIS